MNAKPLRSQPLTSNTPKTERAITVGVGLKRDSITEIKESLVELEDLAFTAGANVIASFTQTLEKYSPSTLLGSGKVKEISEACKDLEADLVLVDHQLSGVQMRNLEEAFGVRVLDRSQLILDIFAQRAQTYEGQLQVELAQMMDQLPRMVGGWLGSLSRLGGGIGTRGPGEKAIELDRRVIRNKMKMIKNKLDSVRKQRSQHRAKRRRSQVPSFALIGYTNAGKSTLLNSLTKSKVLAKDQLFATLDPITRQGYLPDFGKVVLTDTVGFIKNLPTHLIEAFKATLEESAESDILLHVIDLSSPQMESQIDVVEKLIEEFNWQEKPLIHIFNKTDIAPVDKQFKIKQFPRVFISCKTGEGIDHLVKEMQDCLMSLTKAYEVFIPNEEQHLIYELGRSALIQSQEPSSQGTIVKVLMTEAQLDKWTGYLT